MTPVPKILYKYLKPCSAEIFLTKPQLRFTNFVNLDDVLEVLPGQRLHTKAELSKIAREESAKVGVDAEKYRKYVVADAAGPWWGRAMRDAFKGQPSCLCISSLTERWNSDSMWALYADYHKGIAFGVRTDALHGSASKWGQIKYRRKRILLPTQQDAYEKVKNRLPNALLQAALSKSYEWRYQREWRAWSDTEEILFLEPSAVAELIIGFEASPQLLRLSKALKKISPATRIFRAFPHPQVYVMKREEI